ncbi:hypothetical protein, partial [Actinomadura geliboluensis]
MRLSSSLPPAGFTRAEPSPPVRRRVLRTPWLPVAVAALAMGAGFFAVGSWTEPVSPARTVVPDGGVHHDGEARRPRLRGAAVPRGHPPRHRL